MALFFAYSFSFVCVDASFASSRSLTHAPISVSHTLLLIVLRARDVAGEKRAGKVAKEYWGVTRVSKIQEEGGGERDGVAFRCRESRH